VGGPARVTLEALQVAALATASEAADAISHASQAHTEEIVAAARTESAELAARRRVAAERLADLQERERLAEARSECRATVLRAQRSVLIEATTAVHAAIDRLVEDPRYPLLLDRLAEEARERLSAAGPVQIISIPSGGIVARAGSRQLDYSLHAQVDRCLRAMAGELERLWR
jgi:vacuolar-type H+-ATPase subunit E/Vma4